MNYSKQYFSKEIEDLTWPDIETFFSEEIKKEYKVFCDFILHVLKFYLYLHTKRSVL